MIEQKSKTHQFYLINGIFAFVLAIGLTVIFTILGWWQIIWIGPFISGIFFLKKQIGILLGIISVTIVWGSYLIYQILTNSLLLLYDQLGILIIGSIGYNWIFIGGILIIGICFGALGGWCGSSLRQIFPLRR